MSAGFLRVLKLTGAGKLRVAAGHNLRTIAAELGAAGGIDASRCHLNIRLEGPETPQGVVDLARDLMRHAGVGKLRKDAVRALEAVVSIPAGLPDFDDLGYFRASLEWLRCRFGPVLLAVIHRDEAAPHLHVLSLPLVNGRMVGSDLMGGPAKLRALQSDFHTQVAHGFGLQRGAERLTHRGRANAVAAILAHLRMVCDPALRSALWPAFRDAIQRNPQAFALPLGLDVGERQKPGRGRSFTAIMTSKGKGAKTHEAEAAQDRADATETYRVPAVDRLALDV